jgi:hypothetical protein
LETKTLEAAHAFPNLIGNANRKNQLCCKIVANYCHLSLPKVGKKNMKRRRKSNFARNAHTRVEKNMTLLENQSSWFFKVL